MQLSVLPDQDFERLAETIAAATPRMSGEQILDLADRLHDVIRCRQAVTAVRERRQSDCGLIVGPLRETASFAPA